MTRILASISSVTKQQQLICILVLFFLSEAVTRVAFFHWASFHNYSALIKGVFMLAAIIYSVFNLTTRRKLLLLFMCAVSIIFVIGQFLFNDLTFGDNFYGNLVFLGRYLFVFSICLVYYYEFTPKTKIKLYQVYEAIVMLNCAFILVGVVFDIPLFKTYNNRFGYNGVFMAPSISTFFYALALTYFTHCFITQRKKIIQLIVVSIVCFLVGTKALVLFFLLTAAHVFFCTKMYKNRWFYIISGFLLVLALIFKSYVISVFSSLFRVPLRVYREYDLITALTSYRNWRLRDNFLPVIEEKWGALNYLFGGTDFTLYRVEFEIFDVFLFFGIVGTSLYLWFYFKHIVLFKKLTSFGAVQIIFLFLIALLSGTFFNNAPVALYLLIVLGAIEDRSTKWQPKFT